MSASGHAGQKNAVGARGTHRPRTTGRRPAQAHEVRPFGVLTEEHTVFVSTTPKLRRDSAPLRAQGATPHSNPQRHVNLRVTVNGSHRLIAARFSLRDVQGLVKTARNTRTIVRVTVSFCTGAYTC
jgi:hypothetical protein